MLSYCLKRKKKTKKKQKHKYRSFKDYYQNVQYVVLKNQNLSKNKKRKDY